MEYIKSIKMLEELHQAYQVNKISLFLVTLLKQV